MHIGNNINIFNLFMLVTGKHMLLQLFLKLISQCNLLMKLWLISAKIKYIPPFE